jgi:hypothetical protein
MKGSFETPNVPFSTKDQPNNDNFKEKISNMKKSNGIAKRGQPGFTRVPKLLVSGLRRISAIEPK